MRSQLWLLAASSHLAYADWAFGQDLDYRGGEAAHLPRETRGSDHDGSNGWTPRPTLGPSFELARRRQDYWARLKRQADNSEVWVDETTCGWRANTESAPFTCPASHSCATNTDHVVGCTSSGGDSPFFTSCLDYQAVQAGACRSVGRSTGCCMTSTLGECVTYLWPGATVKSMYRCFTERTVVTMLDAPWSSESSIVSTTSTSTSETSTSETASGTTEPAPGQTETDPPTAETGGSNTGAIVGGVVGGIAGLALIAGAIAFVMIRSRKKKANLGGNTAYSAVAPGDPNYPGSPMPPGAGYPPSNMSPQMNQAGQYYNPSTIGSTTYAETPYLSSATPQPAGAYEMRNSYYDPSKPAGQQQAGGFAPYPGPYQPPQPISELDNTNVAPGQQNNPVEMPAGGR